LILLATYNGEEWIETQLRSILAQTEVDLHVVIRDDCSSDGTLAAVERIADARVQIVAGTAASGSASQNFFALIRENSARGYDYVAFADQDDCWDFDKLARACSRLSATGASGYSSGVVAVWENGKRRVLRQSQNVTRGDFLFEGAGQGCTFVLTSKFYEQARGFLRAEPQLTQGAQFHDWTVYALARCWGLTWTFDDRPTMEYRQHDRNSIGAKSSLSGVKRRIELMKAGWYKSQLVTIAEICAAASPCDPIDDWRRRVSQRGGFQRRFHLAAFCLTKGRRRTLDRGVLVMVALMGWI
jgi:rhamnosyltransferase